MTAAEPSESGVVGVVGLGLIGGSILQALARGPEGDRVVGFDLDAATASAASDAGHHRIAGSVGELLEEADRVVVAVPPAATAEAVLEILEASPSALVIDVASVKGAVIDAVRDRAPEHLHRYLPAHPLAGSESGGWEAARAELLAEATWAICPAADDAPAELLGAWAPVLDRLDARIVVCDPAEHDAAVARTSHVAHIVAGILAGSIDGDSRGLSALLSGGGFRDMTRIARSDTELWRQIVEMNSVEVTAAIGSWITEFALLVKAIDRGDFDAVTDGWSRGQSTLELVDATRWAEPAWERRTFAWPAWSELRDLGRAGRAVRKLIFEGDELSADVSSGSAAQIE